MGHFLEQMEKGVRELNSQFWLLKVSAASTVARARALRTLNGVPHSKILDVVFLKAPDRSSIRLRNRQCADDLAVLAMQSARWLPAYFLLLSKSLGESTVLDLLETRVSTSAARALEFKNYRKLGRSHSLGKTRALQALTQAACRGDFAEFGRAFGLAAGARGQLNHLRPGLAAANRFRNRIAHGLANTIGGNPGKSVAGWKSYTDKVTQLVKILEAHL
jgi:hypothetical protein